ncbi:uncharacterized protein G2W53_006821 [Senna tora]|uniref:Uncharacterized protein n=1 Tax=Senna tora TaxID=362788 RepID=A0A834X5T3_9FABA|nr:uncharacterized protein G2W53_006821 [Senna tora]
MGWDPEREGKVSVAVCVWEQAVGQSNEELHVDGIRLLTLNFKVGANNVPNSIQTYD